ncbi:hypothetical protein OS493_024314 [Desmophyllum pertusum]|uniref:Uncharacterized protein n=1 Tax=Desmophyllum pertusum TaxID=174260 RepID=A0A9W9YYC9_9CNID|nr:hypothetical protein OS493_024314 [Desmophyllum pertusum]
MCAEFPIRFGRLFRGPMWSGVPKNLQKDPLTARVNIASPSTRTVQKKTAASKFTTEPGLQVTALKHLKEAHPEGRFWLKTDACDVKSVLQQSVRGEWNGDCDLGDGKLQSITREYEDREASLDVHGMDRDRGVIEQRIRSASDALVQDVVFLTEGLKEADKMYQTKFNSPNTSKSLLMHLCWKQWSTTHCYRRLKLYIPDLTTCCHS